MTKKFEQALAGEFPFIRYEFSPEEQERQGRMGEPHEALYLECGDGWYQLIRDMGAETHQKVAEIVDRYEERSGHVCEICGAPGLLRDNLQWIRALCDKHYQKMNGREEGEG